MRTLKYHEKKLLRKVDFLGWQQEENLREIQIMRRYHVTKRDDYIKCVRAAAAGPHTPATVRRRVAAALRHASSRPLPAPPRLAGTTRWSAT